MIIDLGYNAELKGMTFEEYSSKFIDGSMFTNDRELNSSSYSGVSNHFLVNVIEYLMYPAIFLGVVGNGIVIYMLLRLFYMKHVKLKSYGSYGSSIHENDSAKLLMLILAKWDLLYVSFIIPVHVNVYRGLQNNKSRIIDIHAHKSAVQDTK